MIPIYVGQIFDTDLWRKGAILKKKKKRIKRVGKVVEEKGKLHTN